MTASKTISRHPAVQACDDGYAEGFDYKYSIFLRDGWEFTRGKAAGTRQLTCDTVADFLHAEPQQPANQQ